MKILLWKEFMERRWWVLCWTVAIIGTALFGKGQPFCGEQHLFIFPWQFLPFAMALLVGVGAYASETVRGRALFVFSRPVPWQMLLLAKVLFGVIIMVGVPLLAAIIFRLTCPEMYRPFITIPHLLAGVWAVVWKMGVLYLFGLSCSLVLPGLAGGMLTLTAVMLVMMTIAMPLPHLGTALQNLDGNDRHTGLYVQYIFVVAGVWVAILAAGLRLAHFGLSLEVSERIKRFIPVSLAIVIGSWLISLLLPLQLTEKLVLRHELMAVNVSPTGEYAYMAYGQNYQLFGYHLPPTLLYPLRSKEYIINMADGEPIIKGPFGNNASIYDHSWSWQWASANTAFCRDGDNTLAIVYIADRRIKSMDYREGNPFGVSPDGRLLLVRSDHYVEGRYGQKSKTIPRIGYIDLQTAQGPRVVVEGDIKWPYWWQSNDTIGYRNKAGDRHFVRIKGR